MTDVLLASAMGLALADAVYAATVRQVLFAVVCCLVAAVLVLLTTAQEGNNP